MKFLILPLCFLLTSCSSIIRGVTESQIDRAYSDQIIISEPTKTTDGIELDLMFSGGEWYRNSGICFKKAKATVDEEIIKIRVFVSICTNAGIESKVTINEDLEGSYELVFEDPDGTIHPLKTIVIPEW